MQMTKREELCEMGYDETVVFENPNFDNAIIGVSTDGRAVYNYDLMVEHLVIDENMDVEEAMEFIDYNTIGSLTNDERSPIVMYGLIFSVNSEAN